MTRRSFVAAATTILALLLQAPPVRAAEPVPPAPGLTLRLVDMGPAGYPGWARYEWLDAEGRVYDLGPERWIAEPVAPVPGVALPVVYTEGPIEHGIALGLPRAWAYRVAACESHGNPGARNRSSGAMGLYQFLPSTWAGTPQAAAGLSPYDGYANAAAAAWLYRQRGPQPWSCK